jgi:NADPH:quinone reductase-like Zn-dependent oxidoreductase
MKAITYTQYGSPTVLQLSEVEKPVPGSDEVLIKIRVASVNPLDSHYMRGTPYIVRTRTGTLKPKVNRLGVDVAGHVEAVGCNVTRFEPGDEVFGFCKGAFAEYVCASQSDLIVKPRNVSFRQAAAAPLAAVTALQVLLNKAGIKEGQEVVINGAAGGVGTFAVQIASRAGAHVTGVCSGRNSDLIRTLGARYLIDYQRQDFTTKTKCYDVIVDLIGNHSLSDLRRALTKEGKLLLAGGRNDGPWLAPLTRMLKAVALSRFSSKKLIPFLAHRNQGDLIIVAALLCSGRVRSVIDRSYPLTHVREAMRYLEGGHARGKVVITMHHHDEHAYEDVGRSLGCNMSDDAILTEQTSQSGADRT